MLVSLRIKNLALVDELSLDLPPGYVSLTGETGAGKSILIGGLKLLLGERADRNLIRSGTESCLVEGIFDVRALPRDFHQLLESRGLEACEDNQLLLKRAFSASGANRQYVNGSPTTLQNLNDIGQWLVDLHGPHDHQSLLHPGEQLAVLDAFGNHQAARQEFSRGLAEYRELLAAKEALIVDDATYARQVDLLSHQCQEIELAQLDPESDEELPQAHQRAANAARLLELGQSALVQIGESDPDLLSLIGALGRGLQELRRLDPGAEKLCQLQEQLTGLVQDLQRELHDFVDQINIDPERLRELEDRLNLLQTLKRKYGPTLQAVLEFAERSRSELDELKGREDALQRLEQQLQAHHQRLTSLGQGLTRQRKKSIPRLRRAVVDQLQSLGFGQSRFNLELHTSPLEPTSSKTLPPTSGCDRVEFLFSPNPGEPLRPLRSIASSGEMARVMLAIKTVLAEPDRIPVLVFDEVDSNIGGEIAHTVGEKMRRLGQQHQVICITHLAPVAARAATHYVVSKSITDGRTLTRVERLTEQDRITEVARMLGGQSHKARELATALLKTG
jgi:DNA repair protein RecN (Recombination protein N)